MLLLCSSLVAAPDEKKKINKNDDWNTDISTRKMAKWWIEDGWCMKSLCNLSSYHYEKLPLVGCFAGVSVALLWNGNRTTVAKLQNFIMQSKCMNEINLNVRRNSRIVKANKSLTSIFWKKPNEKMQRRFFCETLKNQSQLIHTQLGVSVWSVEINLNWSWMPEFHHSKSNSRIHCGFNLDIWMASSQQKKSQMRIVFCRFGPNNKFPCFIRIKTAMNEGISCQLMEK